MDLTHPRGDIELRVVSFAYEGVDATLTDITLQIPSGGTVAIVGPSGAGKSTIAAPGRAVQEGMPATRLSRLH